MYQRVLAATGLSVVLDHVLELLCFCLDIASVAVSRLIEARQVDHCLDLGDVVNSARGR